MIEKIPKHIHFILSRQKNHKLRSVNISENEIELHCLYRDVLKHVYDRDLILYVSFSK